MGYKEYKQELNSMYGKNVGSMAADLTDSYVDKMSESMHTDLNSMECADNYKCEKVAAYAATLMNYPHICRMQCERDDLLHNMAKLSNYYEDHFSELTEKQRDYMCKQLTAMRAYAYILQERITYDIQYYSYNTQ